jgi:UDP-N-acetylglucosamine diphosphorylase/glucosamine-1-phosphate N-acetyltransferase
MNAHTLIIYDDGLGRLGPLTATRPSFGVRTGALDSQARIERVVGRPASALWCTKRLAGVLSERQPKISVNPGRLTDGGHLLISGRWAGTRFAEQVTALSHNQALVQSDGQVVAVMLNGNDAGAFLRDGCVTLPDQVSTVRLQERALIGRPWHVLDELPANLASDLSSSDLPAFRGDQHPGVTAFGGHPIRIGDGARVMPSVVIDAEYGPVVIGPGAAINPLIVLQGPCYIGRDAVLVSHTSIRRNTVIGPGCKVGGEISASIMHGYSNKAHSGYLGDSLVGAWVNLGADTSTSNLKNTYGNVRVKIDEETPEEDTGRTFHGSIIGDYVRTAIGTRLPTGAVIHPGCMIADTGWAPKLAMSLGFYKGPQRQAYDADKLIDTIRRAMGRRDRVLGDAEAALIRSLAS